ncbi:MAG: site-specific integrase [Deltaproteobacteria bacterium]|jgi:integrase/recombinase XerC|nr:site-specific integrase [Deltaproteobacteria bacterium]MBT4526559.1 site-specific integrase [Deltaproteobacteria bacterium]
MEILREQTKGITHQLNPVENDLIDEFVKINHQKKISELKHAAYHSRSTIRSAIEKYLNSRVNKNTKLAHRSDLLQFNQFLKENNIKQLKHLAQLPAHHLKALCESWLDFLLQNKLSKITVQRKKGTLQRFFKYLNQELPQLITAVPHLNSEKHKTFYSRAKTNAFTKSEWKLLITYLKNNPKTYRLFVVLQTAMSLGGRRVGEILSLKWSDIDFFSDRVYIVPSKKREDITTHVLPLTESLKNILKEYRKKLGYKLKTDERVFKKETQQRIDSKIKYYVKKAGINKKFSFHSIRTSFVTWANEAGHSQSEILNATLHKSTKMIRYYDQTEPMTVNSIIKLRMDE